MKIFLVGDLILDEPNPDLLFDDAREILKTADVLVGHVEVPHTNRGKDSHFDIPAPPANPEHLEALKNAGFHGVTLAGNHFFDAGKEGVEDTINKLHSLRIKTTGAGMNLNEARKPAIFEKKGLKIGFLSYNCVGPRESWANEKKAGVAYIRVITHYELNNANPGGKPEVFTFAEPVLLEKMQSDIENLKKEVDFVVVAFHKGLVHTPIEIAMYERQIAKAAIEAGADAIVGHHAHILKGIEFYKGKPIFHGLGNFATVTKALNVEENASPERLEWAKKRTKLFGFERIPDYPNYPFHPESRNTMIASIEFSKNGIEKVGFIPCWIVANGSPKPLKVSDTQGKETIQYIEKITKKAGFKTSFLVDEEKNIVSVQQ
ncbi:MAG TPA: CapA family protein [Leadbetterella sp.]|nr:CapA family protein [Leadbetterella sp.]